MTVFSYSQEVQVCCTHCGQIGDGARLRFRAESRSSKPGAKTICTHIEALPPGWKVATTDYGHGVEERMYLACSSCYPPLYSTDITFVLKRNEAIDLDRLHSYASEQEAMNPYALTAQQIFDRVWHHFLVEKQPFSYDAATGRCSYRGAGGARCAVGLFIPIQAYRRSMETKAIYDVIDSDKTPKRLRDFLAEHADLFHALQESHDGAAQDARNGDDGIKTFKAALRGVAAVHGLRVPKRVRRAS